MRFCSTHNIFVDQGEIFDSNWSSSNKIKTPPSVPWDYSRELTIEDVDVWEVVWEAGGGWGVYASWSPYAEFYMVTGNGGQVLGLFYGKNALKKVVNLAKSLNINLTKNDIWVEPEDMWLYQS